MIEREFSFDPIFIREQERPPSLFGRYLLGVIVAFILALLACLLIFTLDIVVKTRGVIVSKQNNITLNANADGVVERILVQRGQAVEKGDILLQLHSAEARANFNKARHDHRHTQSNIRAAASLVAYIRAYRGSGGHSSFLDYHRANKSALTIDESSSLFKRLSSVVDSLREIAQSTTISRSKIHENQAQLAHLTTTLEISGAAVEIYRQSVRQGLTSRLLLLKEEKGMNDIVARIDAVKNEIEVIDGEIARNTISAEKILSELEYQLEREIQGFELSLSKLDEDRRYYREMLANESVVSPVDGVVHEINEVNDGMVMAKGQRLVTLVPYENALEVESWIKSSDIGFVRVGQPAVVKVDAFPFAKYGAIAGKLVNISRDIYELSESQYYYKAKIHLATELVKNHSLRVIPGMSVSAELVTGRRRAYEFLVRPVETLFHDSFKER